MSHYFSERPYYSKLKIRRIQVVIRGVHFEFITAPGVFSSRYIDPGTMLLAENMIIEDNRVVIDLGCGYGVLGIVYAKLAPLSKVYMVDINESALQLARLNAKINNVKNVIVKKSDLFQNVDVDKFDIVLCNPPVSAGLDLNYRIIEESWSKLRDGGILQIVYPLKVADRFEAKLRDHFSEVKLLARSGTHKAYIAIK